MEKQQTAPNLKAVLAVYIIVGAWLLWQHLVFLSFVAGGE